MFIPLDILKHIIFYVGNNVEANYAFILASKTTYEIVMKFVEEKKKAIPVKEEFQGINEIVVYYKNPLGISINGDLSPYEFYGLYKKFYKSGQIKEKKFYKNGKLNGTLSKWNSDGDLEESVIYKDDKIWEGKVIQVITHNKGKKYIKSEHPYKEGKLDGKATIWHCKGVISMEINYKKGILHGPWKIWNSNGIPSESSNYFEGNLHGDFKVMDYQGCVTQWKRYEHGVLIEDMF